MWDKSIGSRVINYSKISFYDFGELAQKKPEEKSTPNIKEVVLES